MGGSLGSWTTTGKQARLAVHIMAAWSISNRCKRPFEGAHKPENMASRGGRGSGERWRTRLPCVCAALDGLAKHRGGGRPNAPAGGGSEALMGMAE